MKAASSVAPRNEVLNSAAQQHKEIQSIADDVSHDAKDFFRRRDVDRKLFMIGPMNSTDDMDVTIITQDPSEKNDNWENSGPH